MIEMKKSLAVRILVIAIAVMMVLGIVFYSFAGILS